MLHLDRESAPHKVRVSKGLCGRVGRRRGAAAALGPQEVILRRQARGQEILCLPRGAADLRDLVVDTDLEEIGVGALGSALEEENVQIGSSVLANPGFAWYGPPRTWGFRIGLKC